MRNCKRGQLPKVIVRYGKPFRFEAVPDSTREQQQEVANVVLERIREIHTELAQLGSLGALRAERRHALA